MAACERPAWTCCLIFLWILMVPGILFTHIAIGKLVSPIVHLADNIVIGFDNVLQFGNLETGSKRISVVSVQAMAKCNYNPSISGCPGNNYNDQTSVDTTTEKTELTGIFSSSLSTVQKVANDKYFGTPDLQPTADNLNAIITNMGQISSPMQCSSVVRAYCKIWQESDSIVDGIGQVNAAIDTFKNSKESKSWNDNADFFTFLHCLPYFTVFAMVFFTFFHWKGGICCCCKGGSRCACLALIPFFLFWFVSFLIFLIIVLAGIVVKVSLDRVHTGELNGNPTLEQAINHIQTEFPEFWNAVFEDMVSGLAVLLTAAFFMTTANIVIAFYTCCQCCCRPFQKKEEKKEEVGMETI